MRRRLFVGREQERALVLEHLRNGRATALVGPPGAGKSRLARKLQEDWSEAYFVELAEARDLSACLRIVARALNLSLDGARTSDEILGRVRAMLPERGLLVLDNVEQLPEDDVQHLLELRQHVGALLFTSQRVVPGTEGVELGGLSPASAVELFVMRAERIEGFCEPRADVEALVERLELMPLAIELAAARTHVLTPKEILHALEGGIGLLKASSKEKPARHRSLQAAITWSYDLLDEEARRAYEVFALFRGGFQRAAAEALLGSVLSAPVVDVLQGLVERSLLRTELGVHGEVRFSMYQAIRFHGAEALRAREEHAHFVRAHAEHYLALCRQLDEALCVHADPIALLRFGEEQANIDIAIERSADSPDLSAAIVLAYEGYLRRNGPASVRHDQLEEAEGRLRNEAGSLWSRIAMLRAESLVWFGDAPAGRELAQRVFDATRESEPEARVLAALTLGRVAQRAGELEVAQRHFEQGLHDAPEGLLRAKASRALGGVLDALGEHARGQEVLREALAIDRGLGRQEDMARTLLHLAPIQRALGDSSAAVTSLEEALPIFVKCGFQRAEANVLVRLASLLDERDPAFVERRHGFCGRALEIYRTFGETLAAGTTLYNMGVTDQVGGDLKMAEARFEEARSVFEGTHDAYAALASARLGAVRAEQGHANAGELLLEQVEHGATGRAFREPRLLAGAFRAVVLATRAQGAPAEEARRIIEQARALALGLPEQLPVGVRTAVHRALVRAEFSLAHEGVLADAGTLWVGEGGEWFRGGRGAVQSLANRPTLQRVLLGLAQAAAPLSPVELFETGWPGELADPAAKRNRVRVALSTLRKGGLKAFLEREDRGHFLRGRVRVCAAPWRL